MFIDTHIVSYAKKGRLTESIRGASISSVVVSELLLVYGDSRTAANYVPLGYPLHMGASIASLKRDHPYSKRSTDRVVFSFGSDFEPLIEFGSNAIAKMVNDRNFELLRQSISYLDKWKQKLIREDFRILIENDVHCVPLRPSTVEIGYRLLEAFQLSGERFKTRFRNGWNDLLILAAAWDHDDDLWSRDSQLNRFAASAFGEYSEWIQGLLKIRLYSRTRELKRHRNRESQSYVTRDGEPRSGLDATKHGDDRLNLFDALKFSDEGWIARIN
jgi:predicted nucleic acid-binding protein